MLLTTEVHNPCRKCGSHHWHRDEDSIGLSLTCMQCGNMQYLDKLGVVVQPAAKSSGTTELPNHDPTLSNTFNWKEGMACTVFRLYHQQRSRLHRGSYNFLMTPHQGAHVVYAYHYPVIRRSSSTQRVWNRRIDYVQVTPPFPDQDMDGYSMKHLQQTILDILNSVWVEGAGQFRPVLDFEVRW